MTILATDGRTLAFSLDDATNFYNQGIDYYSQDSIDESINSFKKAIEINPVFYEAYYNLAKIQLAYGYQAEAIDTYKKVLEISPSDYESMYDLADACFRCGHLQEAIIWLEKIPQNADNYILAQEFLSKVKLQQEIIARELEQTMATIQAPSGVVLDKEGNLYAASFAQNKIYKITPDKVATVHFEGESLGGPIGLAMDENGNLFVANYGKNNILKITTDGVGIEFARVNKPYCLIIDNLNKLLFVTEQEKNKVLKFSL